MALLFSNLIKDETIVKHRSKRFMRAGTNNQNLSKALSLIIHANPYYEYAY